MKITDAQVHIWAADHPDRPWPREGRAKPHRDTPVSYADMLRAMDQASVARAVIVPPSWEGERNDLALEACRQHPDRFAIMGRLTPNPANLQVLRTWRKQPGMMGLRFTYRLGHDGPDDGASDWLWAEVERLGLPLMISCAGQVKSLRRLAERFPGMRMIIDHLALRRAQDAEAFTDLPDLLALAGYPNVAVKASALPSYSSDVYPYRNIHGYLRQVFDAFGPRRTFWGTDMTRLPCTYRQAVTMFTEELSWLTEADKEWVMGRGVSAFIGWAE